MVQPRRNWTTRVLLVAGAALLWTIASASQEQPDRNWQWYKGNLHTHTTHSDGDSSPDFVARWYKEHGYQFLILSDHNYFTDPAGLNTVFASPERFLLIPGEEVTSEYEEKAVHVNAYGIDGLIPPRFGSSVLDTIQQNVDAIKRAGGLASLNHPNFVWSVTADELKSVDNLKLFEVYNGHPLVHNEGGGGSPGLDRMWDVALTAGRKLFGVAVDDAHHFKVFAPDQSNPGRGWVVVKARELSATAIVQAIEAGEFYSSTGVKLDEVIRKGTELTVRIEPEGSFRYTTRFTGADGVLLAESGSIESSYKLRRGEPFVRAVVTDSMGRRAWVQPLFRE